MYSASAVDNATVCCFFELQATVPPAIMVMYPLIDFRSDPLPQSASQKKFSSVLLISASFPPYVKLAFFVCLRYLNILFTAVQCTAFGFDVNCASRFTAKDMSGRVASVRYIRDPISCAYP